MFISPHDNNAQIYTSLRRARALADLLENPEATLVGANYGALTGEDFLNKEKGLLTEVKGSTRCTRVEFICRSQREIYLFQRGGFFRPKCLQFSCSRVSIVGTLRNRCICMTSSSWGSLCCTKGSDKCM